MNDLIPITQANIGGAMLPTVDARSLHEALGIKSKFADWFPRQLPKTGYVENVDYTVLNFENDGITSKFSPIDYRLSLPMALDLASAENTDEARSARRQLVNAALQGIGHQPPAPLSREQRLAKALAESRDLLLEYQAENAEQKSLIEVQTAKMAEDAPKVRFAEAVAHNKLDIEVGEFNVILEQNGIHLGRNAVFAELRKMNLLVSQIGERRNMPTQLGARTGYFREVMKERHYKNGLVIYDQFNEPVMDKVTLITPRGQIELIDMFRKRLAPAANPWLELVGPPVTRAAPSGPSGRPPGP